MAAKVKVTEPVYRGIEDLWNSGRTKMTDVASAIYHLEEMGAYVASDWVQNNYELYSRGLKEGFEIE